MDSMTLFHQPTRYKIAVGIAILDLILIFIALIRHIPALHAAMGVHFPQFFMEAGWWAVVAETLFYCAVLVALYGLISLWLPELRFILWIGVGLVIFAGLIYLMAGVMYYKNNGMGPAIQQGGFMFLLSLSLPFLVFKIIKRVKRQVQSQY